MATTETTTPASRTTKAKLMKEQVEDMSDIARLEGAEVMFLPPRMLLTDYGDFDVRPYKGSEEYQMAQMKAIEDLSTSIGQRQLDTIIIGKPVKSGGAEKYPVLAGSRRVKAMNLENERRSKNGESLLKARCVLLDSPDPFMDALESNVRRQQLGVMDKALLIPKIKERYKLGDDVAAMKKIGRILGFGQDNPGANVVASVIQYQKLLKAPKQLQEDVQSGRIGMQTALTILEKGVAGKEEETVKRAKAIHIEKVLGDVQEKVDKGEMSPEKAAEKVNKARAGRVSETTVVKAIEQIKEEEEEKEKRERKTTTPAASATSASTAAAMVASAISPSSDPTRAIPKSRKEMLEFFEMQDGPANGHENSAAREFTRFFVLWAQGNGGVKADKKLQEKWEEAIKGSYKGKEGAKSTVAKAVKLDKAAKAREVRKAKAAAKPPKPPKEAKAPKAPKAPKEPKAPKPAKEAKPKPAKAGKPKKPTTTATTATATTKTAKAKK